MIEGCKPHNNAFTLFIANSVSINRPDYMGTNQKILRNRNFRFFNPLSAKFIKWSNTLKQIVGKLPTICLSVFDHFSGLALKRLNNDFVSFSTSSLHSLLTAGILLIRQQRRLPYCSNSSFFD